MERSLDDLKQRTKSIRIADNGQKTECFPKEGSGGPEGNEGRSMNWVGK